MELWTVNTAVFCQDLIHVILDQPSLGGSYQTVTWRISHTHKFLVHHQQKTKRYLSFEIKNTSFTYENINKTRSRNNFSCSCLLQMHPWGTSHSLGSHQSARVVLLPPSTPGSSQLDLWQQVEEMMCAWSCYVVVIQTRHALNFQKQSIGCQLSDSDVACQNQ